MKRFALIGLAGYIAPKHLQAIKENGGELVYTHDISDAVGIIDRYFPKALFTTKYRQFKKWLKHGKIDYLVICTPNYLHYKHIKLGLKYCKNVICEKPLVINMKHLKELQKYYYKRINVILQMRLHPIKEQIKKALDGTMKKPFSDVFINYTAPRGDWYIKSWKSNTRKSGGLLYNIGIHLIDFMQYIGCTFYQFKMSTKGKQRRVIILYRYMVIHKTFDMSKGFDQLHVKSYEQILKGKGFHVKDIEKATMYIHEWNKGKK